MDAMSKLTVGTRDVGEKRDRMYYSDPETKPAWLSDKKGEYCDEIVLHVYSP